MSQQERIEQLMRDESFAEDFFSSETPQAAQELLSARGVEVSVEDVTAFGKILAESTSGELTEEQLSDVSGGIVLGSLAGGLAIFKAVSVVVGGIGAAATAGNYLGKVIGKAIVKWKITW